MTLLAKPDQSLEEHTRRVSGVLQDILAVYRGIPATGPRLFHINTKTLDLFPELLFWAAWLHDFGKAARGFQSCLRENRHNWGYRHEILSAALVPGILGEIYPNWAIQDVQRWILTHHKDTDYLEAAYDDDQFVIRAEELSDSWESLQNLLALGVEEFRTHFSQNIPDLTLPPLNSLKSPVRLAMKWIGFVQDEEADRDRLEAETRKALFGRGLLMAADHLASAGQRGILRTPEKIAETLNLPSLRTTQAECSSHRGDICLVAPTGSGKTEAALLWADANLDSRDFGGDRLFYILPFTASINAMYERFSGLFGEERIAVLHGKVEQYLLQKLENEGRDTAGIRDLASLGRKIYQPVKILTPFQILRGIYGLKGFESLLSEMAGARIIVDEIHAYDSRTTGLVLGMLRFLKESLGAKIMVMSATIPTFLRETICNTLGIDRIVRMPDSEVRGFNRHRAVILPGKAEDHWEKILADVRSGKRTLVVFNTVKRAQLFFRMAKELLLDDGDINIGLLHSRFIARDRTRIESGVKSQYSLLIATQVVEVSLDVDFDALYTEPAPIDALLQRFGRANRRGKKGILPVHVFSEGGEHDWFIYETGLVRRSLDVLALCTDMLDEADLQAMVDLVYEPGYSPEDEKAFRTAMDGLALHVIPELIPMRKPLPVKEEYFELFDGYEGIPERFQMDHDRLVSEGELIRARQYISPLSRGQFWMLRKNSMLDKAKSGALILRCRYDDELGLVTDEVETNVSESCIL